ncbi:MAG: DUF4276 family protein [Alphaproteobacteria bacterium]|nr:DUF4276 family protein [Alphaproteobacteria bacterium]
MENTLNAILPGVLPDGLAFRIIPHSGKSDLEKSVPRKLRAWANPSARFVIVRDNDGGHCHTLKARLAGLCEQNTRPDSLVRIVCQELESWFLGDLRAVEASGLGRNCAKLQAKKLYKDPDHIEDAKGKLRELAPAYQARSGSLAIAPHLSLDNNTSTSFNVFISGVRRVAMQLGTA